MYPRCVAGFLGLGLERVLTLLNNYWDTEDLETKELADPLHPRSQVLLPPPLFDFACHTNIRDPGSGRGGTLYVPLSLSPISSLCVSYTLWVSTRNCL